MPLSDRELWGIASTMLSQHGDEAAAAVAERIGALVLLGDWDGVEAWKSVAARMVRLQSGTPQ